MELFSYPATVEEIVPGDFLVRFVEVPEAITGGDTVEEALANAPDALACAIEGYLERDWTVPAPRPAKDHEYPISLDPETAARVVLRRAMKELGISNVTLARRMKRDEKAVRRILSGRHASFSMTLDALKAVGLHPALSV
ncbi:MAG: type II toxin-antitoxin system HicB family antitoxin [Caulobacteraceae bacterium]